jgi:CRISPR/Cas system CSM-associated protein Csm3 (group 7 of RAMP superfamily)
VRGVLTCLTAVHVGGWDASAFADLAVARDGLDQPVIPGTSIAGALRAWLASLTDPASTGTGRTPRFVVSDLFGWLEPGGERGGVARIRVDDAQLLDAAVEPLVRDGVGIDRRTGAAAAGFLFEREVLPAGTRFGFRLVADEPTAGDEKVAAAVEALVAGLRAGRVSLGAARTRGLGQVRLEDVHTRTVDLSGRDSLTAWLAGGLPWHTAGPVDDPSSGAGAADGQLEIEISWTPVTATMVKDSIEGALVDTLPLTETSADGTVRLLLPGSSLKGVLRAHAERIVRTLTGQDAAESLRVVLATERLPGVATLFGWAGDQRHDDRAGAGAAGWRGVLVVADCHGTAAVPAEDWNDVLTVHPPKDGDRDAERSALRERLDRLNPVMSLRIVDHVAVDRWTGGAAENLLFSVLEPRAAAWEPIRLRVDVARFAHQLQDRDGHLAMALLLLVLRDLADGWLTLGFGGARGRGHIGVDQVRFAGSGLPGPWADLNSTTLAEVLQNTPPGVLEAMRRWAAHFTDTGGDHGDTGGQPHQNGPTAPVLAATEAGS